MICIITILVIVILIILILIFGGEKSIVIEHKPQEYSDKKHDRYCPNCGRSIPFDARICPYCAKKFW